MRLPSFSFEQFSLSELQANACSRRQARKNACERLTVGFGLLPIGRESGAKYFSQSQIVAMQNQSNREISTHDAMNITDTISIREVYHISI